MNLRYREDPREWRKSTLLTTLGLAVISSILRWRRVLPVDVWSYLLILLALVSVAACVWPKWFRGYYRVSLWLGYYSSMAVVRVALVLMFYLLLTPAGVLARILGKDFLRLKRQNNPATYWTEAKEPGPLDRMF